MLSLWRRTFVNIILMFLFTMIVGKPFRSFVCCLSLTTRKLHVSLRMFFPVSLLDWRYWNAKPNWALIFSFYFQILLLVGYIGDLKDWGSLILKEIFITSSVNSSLCASTWVWMGWTNEYINVGKTNACSYHVCERNPPKAPPNMCTSVLNLQNEKLPQLVFLTLPLGLAQ